MKRHTFFNQLTPLANKLRQIADETPRLLSVAKDVPTCLDKRAEKLQRRAAAARKAGRL